MKKELTDNELEMDGYKALYFAATPSVDFEKLVNECRKYIDDAGKVHFVDVPLNDEECAKKGWRKDIGYMDYELDEDIYHQIVEDKIKEHKLKGYRAEAFKNTMYLGCGPSFRKK